MPAAKFAKTSDCPDCGAPLSGGVCTACALDFLSAPAVVPTVAAKDAQLDMEFGRYRLKRKLASGGMGVVYVAEDQQLKRKVALKMIRGSTFANDAERARFTVESEAVAGLDHPNIIPIYEIGMIDEQPFFTMKLIGGRNLADCLKDKPSTRRVSRWLGQIAEAVEHAHRRGVLHRDLKPGNILIDEDDNAWLMDFGLAKLQNVDSGLTQSSDHLGTPNYMSPELVKGGAGDVSTASDVWSLGVILWEALGGEAPFRGAGTAEIMRKIAEEEPPRPSAQVDRDLLTLARRCMEKDPARRVATAGDVAEELDRWGRGEPLVVRRITPVERLWKWTRRKPALAALYLALAIGSVLSFVQWQRAEKAVDSLTDINDQLGQALAISTATKLALEARVQVEEDPARALLLAVESVEQTERRSGGVLPEAVESLFATLQQVGGQSASPSPDRLPAGSTTYFSHELAHQLPAIFSPDGQRLLTYDYAGGHGLVAGVSEVGGGGGLTHRWQVSNELARVKAAAWAMDSRSIAILDPDGILQLWEFQGVPNKTPIGNLTREGMNLRSVDLKARSDGDFDGIAVYDAGEERALYVGRFVTDVDGGIATEKLNRIEVSRAGDHTSSVLSPDWRWLLSNTEREPWLINLEQGGEMVPLPDAALDLGLTAFSADRRWMAIRHGVSDTWIFDLQSGDPSVVSQSGRKLFQHKDWVHSIKFSPSGKTVAITGMSEDVWLIPVVPGSGDKKALRLNKSKLLEIDFSPDGRWLAGARLDRVVSIWPSEWEGPAPKPIELRGLTTPALTVKFSPGSDSIAATGMNPAYWAWDLRKHFGGEQPISIGRDQALQEFREIAVSADRNWFAAAGTRRGEVKLFAADGRGEWVVGKHEPHASGVAFDPNGRWFASGGHDGTIKVWEMESLARALDSGRQIPQPKYVLDVSDARIEYARRVAFHPRGTLYATCGDGLLFEWDLNAENPAAGRKAHDIHSIQFMLADVEVSPDGNFLAVVRHGNDPEPKPGETQFGNMVLLFDVSAPGSLVPIVELRSAAGQGATNVDFSADSRWLAVSGAGKPARVWNLLSEDIKASCQFAPVSAQTMGGVAFSPDGEVLALAGSDGRIHLWNWQGSARPRTISTEAAIVSLAWVDGTRLASSGESGRIAVWETDLAMLKERAREIAGRELSVDELRRFRVEK